HGRKEKMLDLGETVCADARKLVTFLHEKVEHGGWNLQQRRLFNAAVDQLWMMIQGISGATGECPTQLTNGTAEEVEEKKTLASEYRKLFSLPDGPLLRNTQDVIDESGNLKSKVNDLRTDPAARQVIAQLLSEDKALTQGMPDDDIANVFDFFINTPLAL